MEVDPTLDDDGDSAVDGGMYGWQGGEYDGSAIDDEGQTSDEEGLMGQGDDDQFGFEKADWLYGSDGMSAVDREGEETERLLAEIGASSY